MVIGAMNPPRSKRRRYREFTAPLSRVAPSPKIDKAVKKYMKFHEGVPTHVQVFEYEDGKPGVTEHVCFKVGEADIEITRAETPDGREIAIKPLKIGTAYSVKAGVRSNKAGQQWIHSHREGGGQPPIHVVDVDTGIQFQVGGKYRHEDWIRG
jgi:hypothetical protein